MYTNTRIVIVTPDGETQEFDICAEIMHCEKATDGMKEETGFTITPKRSRRTPAVTLTDLDFADDICLLSNEMDQAQHLLARIEM